MLPTAPELATVVLPVNGLCMLSAALQLPADATPLSEVWPPTTTPLCSVEVCSSEALSVVQVAVWLLNCFSTLSDTLGFLDERFNPVLALEFSQPSDRSFLEVCATLAVCMWSSIINALGVLLFSAEWHLHCTSLLECSLCQGSSSFLQVSLLLWGMLSA